jgi:hypothetical protein
MRRIIERVVTVVTTTTWTITWQEVPSQPSSEVDPPKSAESIARNAPATPNPSALIEIKEADSESDEKFTKPLSKDIRSHSSKPQRK